MTEEEYEQHALLLEAVKRRLYYFDPELGESDNPLGIFY
jgi:hypothetical protein